MDKLKHCLKKAFSVVLLLLFFIGPAMIQPKMSYAASDQTTIIMLDKVGPYQIGDKVKVTVGVASTDGAYLKEAWCGFGYNGATMKLLSQTDTEDHFMIKSDVAKKWLYYEMEFEMTANGKMFFIAGAYSGDGVIQAIKADGNHISLPRASVLYKIGTGQYTKVSDCNLESVTIVDDQGNIIEMNRSFDKNITDYNTTLDASVQTVNINAVAENKMDEVITPDTSLSPGENKKTVQVKATDGTVKEYNFTFYKPEYSADCENIILKKADETNIDYSFDKTVFRYDLTVPNDCESVIFEAQVSENVQYEVKEGNDLEVGYNTKTVRIYTESDEKNYEYFIYREPSPLTLTSLVAEGSDELTIKLDPEFSPDTLEYKGTVTPDVRRVKFIYTLANEEDVIKEDPEYSLQVGDNECTITVTDGINEKQYKVTITRPAYEQVIVEEEDSPQNPVTPKPFTVFEKRNLTFLVIAASIIFIVMAAANIIKTKKIEKEYNASEEAEIERLIKERNDRLKKKEKERKKQEKNKKSK